MTALIILALILVFSIQYFFPAAYPTVLYPVTSLFWKAESSTVGWFVGMGKLVFSKYSLVKENKRLSDEIAARDAEMLLIESLKSENESLKNSLGRTGRGDDVLGLILARPPLSPYDTLIVDIGSADGVAQGDKVYADGDALIGDIAEVYSHESKVSLFSDPGRTTSVLVGTSSIAAEATGRGGGNFMLKMPAESKIAKGDMITLPQSRPHTFGIVESVTLDSSNSLETVIFRSPRNIQELRFVEVDRGAVLEKEKPQKK